MKKYIIFYMLVILLVADVGYSFLQFYNSPMDGDMAGGIVPAECVNTILENPLGLKAILENQPYPNPNRFFSHWIFKEYFNRTPLLFQRFSEPIESAYLSCAMAKILIMVSLILILAVSIAGIKDILKTKFLIAAVLVTPLFQANGYRTYMGIVDSSTTYTFFYALPIVFLLIYFLPLIHQYLHGRNSHVQLLIKIFWIPLALVVSLSGPLNPGIALVFSSIALFINIKNNYSGSTHIGPIKKSIDSIRKIPRSLWFYLVPISIFSIYSLYLGSFNEITIASLVPLTEMYSRLPLGIFYQFTQKPGFLILFLVIAFNTIYIKRKLNTDEGAKIIASLKWIGLFSLIYILMLPLGGYRDYRPNILRYDTIIPITLCVIFLFGSSTLFLIRSISSKQKWWYIPLIAGVLLIFTNADRPGFDRNDCEIAGLKKIAGSKEKIVRLSDDCSVLYWGMISDPRFSNLNAELLQIWKITDEEKLYYNE